MNGEILRRLSVITPEERDILNGRREVDRGLYMDGSRDVISGDKLLEPGKLITIRPHTRFIAFPEHTHDYVEMVYMCLGETRHTVNGNAIALREGELLMLGQNARQSIAAAGEGDVAVNFIVRPSFFTGTLPFLGEEETPLRRFILSCLSGETEAGYLLFHVAGLLPVQNLVENMLFTLLEDTPNRRGILQMTMGLLFTQLVNHTDALQFTAERKGLTQLQRRLRCKGVAVAWAVNGNLGNTVILFEENFFELPNLFPLSLFHTFSHFGAKLQIIS